MNYYRLFINGVVLYALAYIAPANFNMIKNLFGGIELTALDIICISSLFQEGFSFPENLMDLWFDIIIFSGLFANLIGLYSIVQGCLCNFKQCFGSMIVTFILWGICLTLYIVGDKNNSIEALEGFPIAHLLWGAGMCFIIIASAKLRNDKDFEIRKDRNLFFLKRLFPIKTRE